MMQKTTESLREKLLSLESHVITFNRHISSSLEKKKKEQLDNQLIDLLKRIEAEKKKIIHIAQNLNNRINVTLSTISSSLNQKNTNAYLIIDDNIKEIVAKLKNFDNELEKIKDRTELKDLDEELKVTINNLNEVKSFIKSHLKQQQENCESYLQHMLDSKKIYLEKIEELYSNLLNFDKLNTAYYNSMAEEKHHQTYNYTKVFQSLQNGHIVTDYEFSEFIQQFFVEYEKQLYEEIEIRGMSDEEIMSIGEQYVFTLHKSVEANQLLMKFTTSITAE